jgi:hypothetical protein
MGERTTMTELCVIALLSPFMLAFALGVVWCLRRFRSNVRRAYSHPARKFKVAQQRRRAA